MSNALLSRALYRACLRSAFSPAVKHSRFRIPLDGLPDDVKAIAKRIKPGRDQPGLLRLMRAVWQEGAAETDERAVQKRLDDGFRAMRALGELQGDLEELVDKRVANADRQGIRFCIGEVLRHKRFGFRAVVIGWDRRPEVDVSQWDGVVGLPSGAEQPFYRMLPDLSDCVENLGGPRDVRYVAQENLERLPLNHRRISHPRLSPALFGRFDPVVGRWEPAADLAWQYPGSLVGDGGAPPHASAPLLAAAEAMTSSVRRASSALASFIEAARARASASAAAADSTDAPAALPAEAAPANDPLVAAEGAGAGAGATSGLVVLTPSESPSEMARSAGQRLGPGRDMLSDLRQLLRKCDKSLREGEPPDASAVAAADEAGAGAALLAADADDDEEYGGDEEEYEEGEYADDEEGGGVAPLSGAGSALGGRDAGGGGALELRRSYAAMRSLLKVGDYLSTNLNERDSKSSRDGIAFHVGQVLRHKKFGFRAVVFGWEPRPHLDVSQWDGVVGLPSGAEQPFYRMIPDHGDCVSLLGGPRGVRYVAQENLEPLSAAADAAIEHELLPHLFAAYDPAAGTFHPVQQLAYWYAADAPPSLGGSGAPPTPPPAAAGDVTEVVHAVEAARALLLAHTYDAAREGLLDAALPLLGAARDADEATSAERAAGALLGAHASPRLHQLSLRAEAALEADELDRALSSLDAAVEVDEGHADTYVRRATVHVRLGHYRRALADATKALELEPKHFGAWRWKGAALRGARKYKEAIEAFEAALRVHPWAGGVVNGIYRTSRSLEARNAGASRRGGARAASSGSASRRTLSSGSGGGSGAAAVGADGQRARSRRGAGSGTKGSAPSAREAPKPQGDSKDAE